MSGYVALVNFDGSPVDERLLDRLTQFLAFRGPDRQDTAVAGEAGLGHALLQVGDESVNGRQPFVLDGRYWIVGDVRVDGRTALIKALSDAGETPPGSASDIELIARSYARWEDQCVSRLLGDFSFAIWDAHRRQLFCARDHLGVRPLFYVCHRNTIVVSNTLDCLRQHPGVSSELNELAIADFLLFGENRNGETTSFRSIQRLPAAHAGTWSALAGRTRRYWTLPIDSPIQFRKDHEYVDRFNELLHEAITDRLRTTRATVLMSGGVDSPTLAWAALDAGHRQSGFSVDAVTSVYERLIPDRERDHAGAVAAHLGIAIRYDARDDEPSFADWDRLRVQTPEPVANPAAFEASVKFVQTTARGARILLYGEGPDTALQYEWRPYLAYLARTRQWMRLLDAVGLDVTRHPRLPLWGSARQLATRRSRARVWEEQFPGWLAPGFSARCGCRERWASQQAAAAAVHPVRPAAFASLTHIRWQSLFDDCDISGGRGHAEFRYPFLDIRLLRYLLALPAMPWCRNKRIIRRAMTSRLPETVIRRPKATLPKSADFERVRLEGLPRPAWSSALKEFVDPERIPLQVSTERELRAALRPLGLGYWLAHTATVDLKAKEPTHAIETAIPA